MIIILTVMFLLSKKYAKVFFYTLATLFFVGSLSTLAYAQSRFTVFTAGNPSSSKPCKPLTNSIVLMGGGRDVRAAYPWMIERASQCANNKTYQPGNLVVLRVDGNGDYDKSLLELGPIASVQTLIIPDHASANDPRLDQYIKHASVIWIAGGDQRVYYDAWNGSRLLSLLKKKIHDQHVPVGGASAGMMLLGNYIHTGNPTHILTSAEALANPYNSDMFLERGFWSSNNRSIERAPYPIFLNTIIESHFDTRDRMGRTLTFMARNLADKWVGADPTDPRTYQRSRAIAVDGETALLIEQKASDHSFQASIIINPGVTGSAYFLNAQSYPICDKTGQLLTPDCDGTYTFNDVQVSRLTGTDHLSLNLFNISKWQQTSFAKPDNFERYVIHVKSGLLIESGNPGGVY